ncbi:MAG: protein-glutamate O-methyltransferase CheR [Pseudomonadota bacterium]
MTKNIWRPHVFELEQDDYLAFARLVRELAGINLHEGKKELVRARLAGRIRELELDGFHEYLEWLSEDRSGDELVRLLDSVSTNLTSFFREFKHFDFMARTMLPEMAAEGRKKGRSRLRIWSAGCSTGEEPYSIAMTVFEHSPYYAAGDFKILATDLSTRVLAQAGRGIYSEAAVRDIPTPLAKKYFQKGRGEWQGWFRVKDILKRKVAFRRLNLIEKLPFRQPLDLIFCRNVLIYFDKQMQADLVGRFWQVLSPGGYLLIGHSESLSGLSRTFKFIQPTVYRK